MKKWVLFVWDNRKKCVGFALNNWAKLWMLILLTVLVINLSRACNTICDGGISLDGSVAITDIPRYVPISVSGSVDVSGVDVPSSLDVDITNVPTVWLKGTVSQ